MKKLIHIALVCGLFILPVSCGSTGGGSSVGVYHHHHFGYNPWWGSRDYYRDRVIVVPPEEEVDPDFGVEAPAPPEPELMPEMPDMGMPEVYVDDF